MVLFSLISRILFWHVKVSYVSTIIYLNFYFDPWEFQVRKPNLDLIAPSV